MVTWQIRQHGKALEGPAAPDAPVEVEAVLALDGRSRQKPLEAHATITVDTLAGRPVQEIGHTRAGEHGAQGAVRLAKGLYRVVARGEVTLDGGERRPFVARGPFLRVGG